MSLHQQTNMPKATISAVDLTMANVKLVKVNIQDKYLQSQVLAWGKQVCTPKYSSAWEFFCNS